MPIRILPWGTLTLKHRPGLSVLGIAGKMPWGAKKCSTMTIIRSDWEELAPVALETQNEQ